MQEDTGNSGKERRAMRALRLEDVLRQLPDRELGSLIQRLQIRVDEAKRIDVPSQVARALLQLPEVLKATPLKNIREN